MNTFPDRGPIAPSIQAIPFSGDGRPLASFEIRKANGDDIIIDFKSVESRNDDIDFTIEVVGCLYFSIRDERVFDGFGDLDFPKIKYGVYADYNYPIVELLNYKNGMTLDEAYKQITNDQDGCLRHISVLTLDHIIEFSCYSFSIKEGGGNPSRGAY